MKFHHVALTVKDLAVSIPFYRDLFRFEEVKRFRRDDLRGTGVMLAGKNVVIELWQFDTYQMGAVQYLQFSGIKHIAFTDNDPARVREMFLAKGVECLPLATGASSGRYFFLRDPDGNQIEIYRPADMV